MHQDCGVYMMKKETNLLTQITVAEKLVLVSPF